MSGASEIETRLPMVTLVQAVREAPYVGPVVSVLLLVHKALSAVATHDGLVAEVRVGLQLLLFFCCCCCGSCCCLTRSCYPFACTR